MRRFRFWGRTLVSQAILIIVGIALVLVGIRAIDQGLNYDVVDVGPGYVYHPYVHQSAKSTYYGVHVQIDSMHTAQTVEQRRYDMLYTIFKETDASQLPVEVYYNTGTHEVSKVSYQGRVDQFEGSRSSQLAFGIVLELAAVVLVAGNVVAVVRGRRRHAL